VQAEAEEAQDIHLESHQEEPEEAEIAQAQGQLLRLQDRQTPVQVAELKDETTQALLHLEQVVLEL
jgi:hypothetical protein